LLLVLEEGLSGVDGLADAISSYFGVNFFFTTIFFGEMGDITVVVVSS
jgi:hypothetical protein